MSDCLIFACLFAAYGVLRPQLRGGAVAAPTCSTCRWSRSTPRCCCSRRSPTASRCSRCSAATRAGCSPGSPSPALLGAGFIGIELYEFAHLIHEGAGPQRSAFLSAFFALVGTHGLHVTFGIIWLVVLMVQVGKHGLIPANRRRLMCLSMFWHFLDVVWIGVFTFVYLMGMLP